MAGGGFGSRAGAEVYREGRHTQSCFDQKTCVESEHAGPRVARGSYRVAESSRDKGVSRERKTKASHISFACLSVGKELGMCSGGVERGWVTWRGRAC